MPFQCAILSIGSELLEGSVADTNSSFLGSRLLELGIKPKAVLMVPDDREMIIAAMKEAASKYPAVFTTGGLGPTFDDITAECLGEAAERPLELNQQAFQHMKKWLDKTGVTIHEGHKRQAMLPKGCDLFENSSGTALGFGVSIGNSYILSMPGVPSEMKSMFDGSVAPFIKEKFPSRTVFRKDAHFASLPESDIDKAIEEETIPRGTECIINAGKGEVVVKLRGEEAKILEDFALRLSRRFPDNFIGFNGSSPIRLLMELLKEKGALFGTAESCTGGLIGKMITDEPGASQVFAGGVISYSNKAKELLLGVREETLKTRGAVSEETAAEMAEGARKALEADLAVSVTGIAGPGGGTEEKPVGTVCISVSSASKTITKTFHFRGEREEIRVRAANAAVFMSIKLLKDLA